jgi:hypothetical protein
MSRAGAIAASLLWGGVAAADGAAPAPPTVVTDSHARYDPGLGVWVAGEGRAYESLDGAATALGVGVGYSWDLVDLQVEYLQSVVDVAGQHPGYLKLAAEYAFITWRSFSAVGRTALDIMFDPPHCQVDPLNRAGPDCQVAQEGVMIGPELNLGARYRWSPKWDVYANAGGEVMNATAGSRRDYFNPGFEAGLVFHPFGRER